MEFELDKSRWGTFRDQIADWFRTAIRTGVYRPGERLPGRRELAARLGVSVRVVTRAFKMLADEGVVTNRPGAGCTVLAPTGALTKGIVLLVVPGGDFLYYANIRVGRIIERLLREGYLPIRVGVPATRGHVYDTRGLDVLLTQAVRLVVMTDPNATLMQHLDKRGIGYVVVGVTPHFPKDQCIGCVRRSGSKAYSDMIAAVRSCGIRSAALFAIPDRSTRVVAEALDGAGIRVADWSFLSSGDLNGRLDTVRTAARNTLKRRLAEGRGALPDLIFFGDEYRAEGGLVALQGAGISVPEDIRVICVSNVGNAPVLNCSLAKIEWNPFADGDLIAEALLEILSTGRFPDDVVMAARFVPGKSLSR